MEVVLSGGRKTVLFTVCVFKCPWQRSKVDLICTIFLCVQTMKGTAAITLRCTHVTVIAHGAV